MNKAQKIFFSGVVASLLVVGSFIYVISRPPPGNPMNGITAWNALSKSRVEDKAKEWNPDVALAFVSAGTFGKTNITMTGKSSEWDFMYCYYPSGKPNVCKIYYVNKEGVIFKESSETGCSSCSILPTWTVDSDKAAGIVFHSSNLKSEFSDLNKIRIFSMVLNKGYVTNDDPYWHISIIEYQSDYPSDFHVNANTGEIYN